MGSTDQSGTEGLSMNTLVHSGQYLELNAGPDLYGINRSVVYRGACP
jgi:hypothetical protein